MVQALPTQGLLRVVKPEDVNTYNKSLDEARVAEQAAASKAVLDQELAGFITTQFSQFKRHRSSANGWNDRLLAAMRSFNGQYDPSKLADIQKFGGSEIYARLVAMKCRGASSLLRDVYLGPELPWGLRPPADPDVPPEILQSIQQLVGLEVQGLEAAGQPPDVTKLRDRTEQLTLAARQAAKKRAAKQAAVAQDKIQEILTKGGFYGALAELIQDVPLFPFGVVKGPVVRIVPSVQWGTGAAVVSEEPRLFWNRVSPFDVWWTPGASSIEGADVIERTRVSRADLNDLLDLPGYNVENIRKVLDEYGRGGLSDNWDETDNERAQHESRENPVFNQSGLITCLEYHGNVQGRMLREYGMTAEEVPDELRDYFVQVWLIGRYVIKVQMSPSPRKRHPYFATSFEKVPGTPVGNGLPDILADIQDLANATLRSLVNNLSIASGPQVVVNHDRLAASEDGQQLYPWKRWAVTSDPLGNNTEQPVSFFHPNSNAQELLAVYQAASQLADDLSAIPKYVTGGGAGAGAGRTASGLAMLMGNAAKILQTVAANIDRDVIEPALESLFDMVMMTDESGLLTGQEKVEVLGVTVAIQKETQRARQIEFLTTTANPVDMGIIGPKGRASVLRAVANGLGLEGSSIVPTEDDLDEQERQAKAQAEATGGVGFGANPDAAAQAQGSQQGEIVNNASGPQTNTVQGGMQ